MQEIEELTREHSLYMRGGPPWTADSEGCILECDIYSNELPEFAKANGLIEILPASDVLDVVENARLQKPSVSDGELVEALSHYYSRDAFIDLGLK
uniref:DUF7716 domain-containing protein n=1 Tax=Hyalangium gracile TaxID=394092 RepID=UPI001CCFCB5A|nr:hypothetical protein [Hyalangium gracile]